MRHSWFDPRLVYPSSKAKILYGESWYRDKIWYPNIYVVNEKDGRFLTVTRENVYVSIMPSGLVQYNYR